MVKKVHIIEAILLGFSVCDNANVNTAVPKYSLTGLLTNAIKYKCC